ncbi:MAG: GGDEF domain-containing protein [Marinobacterium sp.]|nr:GGDEF domain-containing protein [Marinobacterium sp.]
MVARLFWLLFPSLSLLLGTSLLLGPAGSLAKEYQTVISLLPYLLTLLACLLGYGFNRSHVVLGALNLCCAYLLIKTGLQTSLNEAHTYVLFVLLSLLLPIHIGLIAIYRERGLLTPYGIFRITIILSSYLTLYLAWQNHKLGYMLADLPMFTLEMMFPQLYLSQAATFVFALALLPASASFLIRRTHTEASILTSLLTCGLLIAWFDTPVISALFICASLIALCLSVMQTSHDMAYLDELTGIPARRALMAKFDTLGRRYSVAMMDVDHFKKFNDTYGHDIGDQVLKMVAVQIDKVSGGGKAFRYGGEEFTVIFAGKSEHECMVYLEEVRERIASYPMRIRNQSRPKDNTKGQRQRRNRADPETVHVTISIGVADSISVAEKVDSHPGPMDVVKVADQALYAAKESGRNRTVAAHQTSSKKKAPHHSTAHKSKVIAQGGAPKDFAS